MQAFREAEAYDGPSLILAYSHCIAHGFDLRQGMNQQDKAVASGYWPLLRYDPALRETVGEAPFRLDSPRPTLPFKDYAYNELRYSALAASRPGGGGGAAASRRSRLIHDKYRNYEEFAAHGRGAAGRHKRWPGASKTVRRRAMDLTTTLSRTDAEKPAGRERQPAQCRQLDNPSKLRGFRRRARWSCRRSSRSRSSANRRSSTR